jgi:integrase
MEVSTANSSLRVLRHVLNLTVEWGVLSTASKIKVLSGEPRRERVITPDEEAHYPAAIPEPLASIAVVLADTGIRPEECFRLRWENVIWFNGRNGVLLATRGKTAAARRVIPMTGRVRAVLETRWDNREARRGLGVASLTRSGHVEPSSVRKQHAIAFKVIAEEAAKRNEKPVRPFVLYSLRHTFLTRLGQSGCDVWTLARIVGHSLISISARYVHPAEDAALAAVERLGGHKIGHTQNGLSQLPVATSERRAANWRVCRRRARSSVG